MFLRILIFLVLVSASSLFGQEIETVVEKVQPVPANSTIRGRVFYLDSGRPVRRTSVLFVSSGNSAGPNLSALTDNEGYFQVAKVKAGKYFALVNAPGVVSPLAFIDPRRSPREFFDESTIGFDPILVNGVDDIDVNIPVRRGGAISGRVTYADGDPAVGVRVEILRRVGSDLVPVLSSFAVFGSVTNNAAGVYQTDDRGYFRYAGLPAGQFTIRVNENVDHTEKAKRQYSDPDDNIFGTSSFLTVYYPDISDPAQAQTVDIELGQEHPEINILIPDRALRKLEGKVVSGKEGAPLKNVRLYLKRKGERAGRSFPGGANKQQDTTSDEKGIWRFEQLPPGTYEIAAEPPSESEYDYEITYGSNSANSNLRPKKEKPVHYARQVREVTIGEKDQNDLVLKLDPAGKVSGAITVENSKEFPDYVSIGLFNEEGLEIASESLWVSSMGDGTKIEKYIQRDFVIDQVPPGKVYLRVFVPDQNFYVKSALLKNTDLLLNLIDVAEGQFLDGLQVTFGVDVGTLKGKVVNDKNDPEVKAEFFLIPTDSTKRRNPSFYVRGYSKEEGAFEIKSGPGEYAVIFKGQLGNKTGEEYYKALDEAIKTAEKITVKSGEVQKTVLKLVKTQDP
jgi:hypothetical protein